MPNHASPVRMIACACLAACLLAFPSHAEQPAPQPPAAPATPTPQPPTAPTPPAAQPPAAPAPQPPTPPAPRQPAAPADETPLYPEEADGESSLWLDLGGYGLWLTERDPLASSTPLSFGLGFAHRVGPARLAWRAHVFAGLPGDDPLLFVYLDLLSIEYVFSEGALRPWVRGAIGLGIDLQDSGADLGPPYGNPSLGDDAYFNAENGPSGGFGIAAGGGLDLYLTDAFFARAEADIRAYGGAGRTGVMLSTHLGLGWSW